MRTDLVILAGGLGSRFGGDKAFTSFGPADELLLEYTLYDARRAGITAATLVVPPGAEDGLGAELGKRVSGIELRFVAQDRYRPYAELDTPERARPWGTAHAAAIACASVPKAEACVIVNADDWYGPRAITALMDTSLASSDAALVTWPLRATLSRHGGVNRGVCVCEGPRLVSVRECYEITELEGQGEARGRYEETLEPLALDTPVSLNCWALRRPAIDWLCASTRAFIEARRGEARVEAQLPTILMDGMAAGKLSIHAHALGTDWAGVTFKADGEALRARLASAAAQGVYPNPLWSPPT